MVDYIFEDISNKEGEILLTGVRLFTTVCTLAFCFARLRVRPVFYAACIPILSCS